MPTSEILTEYVIPPKNWEKWKTEYRFGAFYIFPPEPIRTKINQFRKKYDPQYQPYCDAHISLTIPLPCAIDSKDIKEFINILAEFKKFIITYEQPSAYPGISGVVLRVFPEEKIKEIVKMLELSSPFRDAIPRKWPFSPHITIAEFVSKERTEQILDELSANNISGSFDCEEISYAVPDVNFCFTERFKFKLS